jgi:opacity protein-like surface antigen
VAVAKNTTTYNPLTGVFTPIPKPAPVPSTAALGWTPAGGGQVLSPGAVANTNVSTPVAQAAMAAAAAPQVQQPVQPQAAYVPPTPAAPVVDPNAARRTSAFDRLKSMFSLWGLDMDGSGLAGQLQSWISQDYSDDRILTDLRGTAAYNNRFTGMADLIKRGHYITEGQYIDQEIGYRKVMNGWGLPTNFYDDPTDYGRFIANGVSISELDDRIKSAKTFLDEPASSEYRKALNSLGVSDGTLLAHVLDGDRAQNIIQKEMKAAAFGGAANKFRFGLNADQMNQYGGTLGDSYNRIGIDQRVQLESTLSKLSEQADSDERLSSIDNEAFKRSDTLDAEVGNDTVKRTAGQKRVQREQARFSGSSAFTSGSLSSRSGF